MLNGIVMQSLLLYLKCDKKILVQWKNSQTDMVTIEFIMKLAKQKKVFDEQLF